MIWMSIKRTVHISISLLLTLAVIVVIGAAVWSHDIGIGPVIPSRLVDGKLQIAYTWTLKDGEFELHSGSSIDMTTPSDDELEMYLFRWKREIANIYDTTGVYYGSTRHSYIVVRLWWLVPILPLYPILFFYVPMVRRYRRRRRNACVSCGYSLQGLTELRCPECGTAFDMNRSRTPE